MNSAYVDIIAVTERLHRQCLEVVKLELDRAGVRDLNSVQAMILFNIGDAELTVGELTQRGYYQGSNVSYNVKKMVENGYLSQERSRHDRRSYHVRASRYGLEVRELVQRLFDRQAEEIEHLDLSEEQLIEARDVMVRIERLWAAMRQPGARSSTAAA